MSVRTSIVAPAEAGAAIGMANGRKMLLTAPASAGATVEGGVA